jgi:AraC-like DNA-binding protein
MPVGPGEAFVFRYGESTEYRIGPRSTWPYVLEYVVLGQQGGIGELLDQLRAGFGDVVRMEDKGEAARILHSLVLSFENGTNWDHLELAGLAYRLVIALYREQITGSLGNDPVAYLQHQLQNQFRSHKSMKEWIQDLPLSREHVTRVFRERYGESPAAFLRNMRLDHARLLAQTSSTMSAEDIAAASGFAGAQTLRRAFRKRFGRSLGSL